MTVLLRSGVFRLCSAAGLLSLAATTELVAQRAGANAPCTQPATILIAWPRAENKADAKNVRDKVFSTLKDFPKGWCLLPRDQIDGWLEGSRFPTDSVLSTRDWIQLGNMLRADEVLEITAKPGTAKGDFDLTARLTLVRDENLRDSVPKIEQAGTFSVTTKNLAASLAKVRAQLTHEAKCYSLGRDGKFGEAETAARAALAAYPGNIARLCLATALREGKKNPEEVISLSEDVRKTDPSNGLALLHLLNTYLEQNNNKKYAEVATIILSADPGHRDAETIISNLAAQKQTDIVIRLLETALQTDPDNTGLRRLEFRVVFASDNLKEIEKKGEAIAKLDTAFVDTLFIQRMASTYARDSVPTKQLEKVGEWYARGTSKFPQNLTMVMALAQTLAALGQPQQAIDEYKRVIRMNPQAARGIRLYIARTYNEIGQPDSAAAYARQAAESGDDRALASNVILQIGNKLFTAAQQSKAIDDYKKAIPYLAYADSLAENHGARFLWGASALGIAGQQLQALQSPPPTAASCPAFKEAREWVATATEKLTQGGRFNPQLAGQLIGQANSFLDFADRNIAALKCPTH